MSAEIESLNTERPSRSTAASPSPLVTAIAGLALLLAAYAHLRLGGLSDRDEGLRQRIAENTNAQAQLNVRLNELAGRLDADAAAWRNGLASLDTLPAQVGELDRSVEELRARTEAPQRAWIGAEAAHLLDLAERRLSLEGDVETAIVAMTAADARLATLKDAGFGPVREQLAKEIAALRAVPVPDYPALLERLAVVEAAVPSLPVLGIPVSKGRREATETEAASPTERARRRIAVATRDLLSLRRVDPAATRLVTLEEESLRRQHLELLLLSARIALMQRDGIAYRDTIIAAGRWLEQNFDPASSEVTVTRDELAALATVAIDPARPQIGNAARMLQRLTRNAAVK